MEGSGEDNLVLIDSSRSVDVFGVSIRVKEFDKASLTAAFVAASQTIFNIKKWYVVK